MIFKSFRNISIFYISIIIFLTAVGVYVFFNTYFWLTSVWIFIFDITIVAVFIRFILKEYRKLSNFLVSIEQEDFSVPYAKSFKDLNLNKSFQRLSKIIVSLRDEAQINYQYLQTIINHINTAIVCVDKNQKVALSNHSANNLFNKNVFRDIHSLKIANEDLPGMLENLQTGEKKLVKFNIQSVICNYSIQVTEFKMRGDWFKLFSFQNVQSELEQNELESWQKLTRVITHEIRNSVIPISNLSGLVYKQLFDPEGKFVENLSNEVQLDIQEGIKTIENRSKSLVAFVEATQNFTKMPKPEIEQVNLNDLVKRVVLLLKTKLKESNIDVQIKLESNDLNILVDKSLIEHALINLMLNAIDALKEQNNPTIAINGFKNKENRIVIMLNDNGKGISDKDLENIFVPFFTTKREGSGIGLSLVRQIMFLHKGNISVKSQLSKGTTFTLSF